MIINHNIASLNTYRQLSANSVNGEKSLQKLSSGLRINKAGDDAAGLAISEKMRGQIRGLDQASRNAQDSISLIQTAEGGLNEAHSILQRVRELAVQAANDTNTSNDREEIQKEVNQLTSEIDRIANTTEFNNKLLMTGTYGTTASSSNVTNLTINSSKSDNIIAGTYAVTITSAATQDKFTSTVDSSAGITFVGTTADTLVVNGTNITFAAGLTNQAAVVTAINAVNSETHVTASVTGNNIVLTDDRFGAHPITIGGNAQSLIMGAAPTHTTTGANAVIGTVGGVATTATADSTNGQKLTITTGALKGMVITALNATGATITVNKSTLDMQIGANEGQSFSMTIQDMRASSLGVATVDVSSASAATSAITTVQEAIDSVSAERSKLGGYQNRLEHTINNLGTTSENLTASESRIRDVDMAKEMMEFTKNNILSQAATAMLAQANQQPQQVLKLLQ